MVFRRRPSSTVEAELLAHEIARIRGSRHLRPIERLEGLSKISIGDQEYGVMVDSPLPDAGPWPVVGILDEELAQIAWNLDHGTLIPLGAPGENNITIPVTRMGGISERGPYHADIYWANGDGAPRGPFELLKLEAGSAPTYPILWGHHAKRERSFVVESDSAGRIKAAAGGVSAADLQAKAAKIWETAAFTHYNRDLRFNSQSLIVATTERACVGGASWPSVILHKLEHVYPFALWCNSTLGLVLHWWVANKTQSGRGRTSVTGIPNIPTLDLRELLPDQIVTAKVVFEDLKTLRFLPFDQIDEDPARAELDRRLIIDVLRLPGWLCDPDGPIDLLRRKLAREPQIHGGKKSRVVFRKETDETGRTVLKEGKAKRNDRGGR